MSRPLTLQFIGVGELSQSSRTITVKNLYSKLMQTKNKSITSLLALVLAACIFLTGCATLSSALSNEQRVNTIATVMRSAVSLGVSGVIAKNPDTRSAFVAVAAIVKTATSGGTYDPESVTSYISAEVAKLATTDDQSQVINLAVSACMSVMMTYYQQFYNTNIEKKAELYPYCVTLLNAAADGILAGTAVKASSADTALPKLNPEDYKLR